MQAKVQMNDKCEFLITLDLEAMELLNQLCRTIDDKPTDVIERFVLGGIALQNAINIEIATEAVKDINSRYVRLLQWIRKFI